jgi:hypothetical protein
MLILWIEKAGEGRARAISGDSEALAMASVGTSLIGDAETVGGEKDQKQ